LLLKEGLPEGQKAEKRGSDLGLLQSLQVEDMGGSLGLVRFFEGLRVEGQGLGFK
jgi:hypothetical protein